MSNPVKIWPDSNGILHAIMSTLVEKIIKAKDKGVEAGKSSQWYGKNYPKRLIDWTKVDMLKIKSPRHYMSN